MTEGQILRRTEEMKAPVYQEHEEFVKYILGRIGLDDSSGEATRVWADELANREYRNLQVQSGNWAG